MDARLHMRPSLIADAVMDRIAKTRAAFGDDVRIFVAYADCGTGGALDAVLEREGIERIAGAHCYEFYAGSAAYAALQDEELGTFYLTDFLARQFESLVLVGLGLDRHPELIARLLRQLSPGRVPRPDRRPRPHRPCPGRRRPPRAHLRTPRRPGYGELAPTIHHRDRWRFLTHGNADGHLVAGHPGPGDGP